MDHPANPQMDIFRNRLLAWLQEELDSTDDANLALRKALLGLLYVDSGQSYVRRFRDYLLRDCHVLADRFDNEDSHPFVAGQDIRLLDRADGTELLIHQSLIDSVMKAPLTADDLEGVDVRVPWEPQAKRLVGCFMLHHFYPAAIKRGGYGEIADLTAELSEAVSAMESFGPWKDEPEGPWNYPGCWIRVLQLGELMFVFTRDADTRSQITMQMAAQNLFMRAARHGYGLRGGIAYGECTVDFEKQTFFGFAMLVARQLAARQRWFGVALDTSMDALTGRDEGTPPPPDIADWIPLNTPYAVPVGGGCETEELSAINWPMFYKDDPSGLHEFLGSLRDTGDLKFPAYLAAIKEFGHEMIRQMNMRAAS